LRNIAIRRQVASLQKCAFPRQRQRQRRLEFELQNIDFDGVELTELLTE